MNRNVRILMGILDDYIVSLGMDIGDLRLLLTISFKPCSRLNIHKNMLINNSLEDLLVMYEDIIDKVLNPSALNTYCDSVVQHMDSQSCAYVLLSNDVSNFVNDSNLRANSVEGFQMQMQGYITALGGLCMANEQDKYDIGRVKEQLSAISEDKLDGTEIFDNYNKAIQAYDDAIWFKNYWNDCAEQANWWEFVYIGLCRGTALHYSGEARDALHDKELWEGLAIKLINFEDAVEGLFTEGKEMRDIAKRGLEQISTSFNSTTGTYAFPNGDWMFEIVEAASGDIIDTEGNINWELVDQLLSKDGDTISDLEYQMLACAYVNADVEDLNHFFTQCGHAESINWEGKSRFIMDSSKLEGIMEQTYRLEENLLYLEMTGNYSKEEFRNIEAMRNAAIQRYLVIEQFKNSPAPLAGSDEEFFNIRECELADGVSCIEIQIRNQIQGGGRSVWANMTTIRVSEPISDGEFLEDFCRNYSFDMLSGTVSSATQVTGNTAAGTAISTARDKAAEKILKSAFRKGEKYVPVVGFVFDLVNGLNETYEQHNHINSAANLNNVADLAADFGCTGVVIQNGDDYTLSMFAGTETRDRMETYTNNTNVDVSNLFTEPGKTAETIYEHECEYRTQVDNYSDVYVTPGYHLY